MVPDSANRPRRPDASLTVPGMGDREQLERQARDLRGRVRANGADFAPLRVRPIDPVLHRLCLAVARTALPTGEAIAARDAEHGTPAWGAFSSLVLHRGF